MSDSKKRVDGMKETKGCITLESLFNKDHKFTMTQLRTNTALKEV